LASSAKALWDKDGLWSQFLMLEKKINEYLAECLGAGAEPCHVNWGMVGTATMTTEATFFETPKGDRAARLIARCEAQENICKEP
jgi:hypothetical protein